MDTSKPTASRSGYKETVITFDRSGEPKGSSNVGYLLNAKEYEALKAAGAYLTGSLKK